MKTALRPRRGATTSAAAARHAVLRRGTALRVRACVHARVCACVRPRHDFRRELARTTSSIDLTGSRCVDAGHCKE